MIAAAYSGSEVTVPEFEYGKTNNTAEFLKKFPFGKVKYCKINQQFVLIILYFSKMILKSLRHNKHWHTRRIAIYSKYETLYVR